MNALKPPGEGMVLFDFPPDPKTANNHFLPVQTGEQVTLLQKSPDEQWYKARLGNHDVQSSFVFDES